MRFKTKTIIIFSIITFFLIVGGLSFLAAFISDKLGQNYLYLGFGVLVFVSLIFLIKDEIKETNGMKSKMKEYLEIGKLLFENNREEFETFYNSRLQKNRVNIRPIEIIQEFSSLKKLSLIVDSYGEENEGEVKAFVSLLINQDITWNNTNNVNEENIDYSEDEFYILKLFKAIDKDLVELNKKLLFFDLGTDSYIFTVTDKRKYHIICKCKDFHGSEKLN
ncbi:MAG: hypothetical protein ACEQSR_02565 [Candidatus Methylacidiphilales bacterium]